MPSNWDQRFWDLAKFVAEWSKDPNAKVGAVIATQRGAVGLGYNGFPKGVEDSADRLDDGDVKLDMIVHAEQNALLIAGQSAQGADIFVRGKPVCARCAGLIIQAGIRRVVAMDPTVIGDDSKWRKTGMRAVEMLNEARVIVSYME
jgi:dCMP deaminase